MIPRQNQIVVQGNTRLDSSVVIRDSLIDIDNTEPKDLSMQSKIFTKQDILKMLIFLKEIILFLSLLKRIH